MYSLSGCVSKAKYAKYSSQDPLINIAMDYPSGWKYSEQRGSKNSFAQVIFYELGRKDREFTASMVVTVEETAKLTVSPPTLENVSEDIIGKVIKQADAKLLIKKKIKLLGQEGYDLEFSYTTLDNLLKANAKSVAVKERTIVVEKDGKLYTMRYENTADEFDKVGRIFYHCVKSIKLKGKAP